MRRAHSGKTFVLKLVCTTIKPNKAASQQPAKPSIVHYLKVTCTFTRNFELEFFIKLLNVSLMRKEH